MPFPVAPYDTCSFCLDLSGERECAFVTENDRAAAQVDERQYERGAMLIIPRHHRETILDIEESELEAVYALAKRMTRAVDRAYGAVGANIYQNNGLKASQHEPHFHVHVVPKYEDSESEKLFLQRNYDVIAIEEQRQIASTLRAAL
jgi:diadenosine tetraphosphate (Ap4A) HIT family hydrolase